MTYLKIELRDLVRIRRQMHGPGSRIVGSDQPLPVLECRPILVNTASADEKGCLILADGRLIAVLVYVTGTNIEQNSETQSGWHMEAGFGRCAMPISPLFDTLADAFAWMRMRLSVQQSAVATL